MNKYGTSVIYVEKFFKFNFSNHVIYSIVIHNLPQDTSCDIFILYFHFIFSFHRKTHLRCISSVLLHYNCNINANIEDVYHRPNLERAPKGRLPLVIFYQKFRALRALPSSSCRGLGALRAPRALRALLGAFSLHQFPILLKGYDMSGYNVKTSLKIPKFP